MAVDGSYQVSVEMMGNKGAGVVTLETSGTRLKGSVVGMGLQAELQDGTVSGDSFSGSIEGPTPLGTMRFKVTGTVTGDRIEGKLSAGLIKAPFSGTRA